MREKPKQMSGYIHRFNQHNWAKGKLFVLSKQTVRENRKHMDPRSCPLAKGADVFSAMVRIILTLVEI